MPSLPKLRDLKTEEIMERVDAAFQGKTIAQAIELLMISQVAVIEATHDYPNDLGKLLVAEAEMTRHIIYRLDRQAWLDGFALFEEENDA